ncbi:MAG: flagellar basal body rod protein FlgC [Kofleriaceae bacterium]|mgnify:CR=1 FL=1|jgi:flagellar basal-body rod protein FlgC|nr:flagellar basal body rod protein FlgC [Kofleriaceae bacterium]MBP6839142.1 flagellar basal body rod protein FlgC [Kofleriaceae bacterium]MBP9204796.1 flagellar basal body rod protein FlgC [Kofleriaceae bacterium]
MDFFTAMEVSATGLSAERVRMNVSASNLANASTTRTAGGGPYQRRDVVLESVPTTPGLVGAQAGGFAEAVRGVTVRQIASDGTPPRLDYDPGHPDANVDGYVAYPNVNPVEEMVDMITASRAYEAGVTALSTAVSMAESALGIGR